MEDGPAKLRDPGKRFFLQLVANVVQDVDTEVDANELSDARKAMIRCGFSLDVNGIWHLGYLFPHLQDIVGKYVVHFDNEPAPENLA